MEEYLKLSTAERSVLPDDYQPEKISGDFCGKHIISVEQFARDDLEALFAETKRLQELSPEDNPAANYLLGLLFYEPSTRTDMSFQSAMKRLGGEVVAVSNGMTFSSAIKGENLADSVKAAGCYVDAIILRHPAIGASLLAAYHLDALGEQRKNRSKPKPILINAGDGSGEHPTQALLDLYTILEHKHSLDNLNITMVGDLKHGRTVHSLAKLLAIYGGYKTTINFVAPPSLALPEALMEYFSAVNIEIYETDRLDYVLPKSDVIYWTRVQEERFSNQEDYYKIKDDFIMRPEILNKTKPEAILMHPLPRKHEMGGSSEHDILDRDPRSIYFSQMENGMYVRMALLAEVLDLL